MKKFKTQFFKNLSASIVVTATALVSHSGFAQDSDSVKPDIYFDLGNVLVDTRDWTNVDYVHEAKEYVSDLKSKGYQVRLMINFVDQLGTDTYRTCEEKFAGLVGLLESKWTGSEPFDWMQFDLVILPPTNEQRKPKPYMFVNALSSSCPRPVLYQGEDTEEMAAANFLGLGRWRVSLEEEISLLPESEIASQIEATFRYSYPDSCDFKLPKRCNLDTEKMKSVIESMNDPEPSEIDVISTLEFENCINTMKEEVIDINGASYWKFSTTADECDGGNVTGSVYTYDLKTPVAHIADGDFVCRPDWLERNVAN